MRTSVRTLLILVALAVASTVALPALAQAGETPPRPAPPNRPDLPGAPPKEVDDLGYCIVGGPLSLYCSFPGISDCIPIPTSLQVPKRPFEQDVVGWSSSPNASQCGTESCFIILRCECGATILNQVCGA